MFRVYYDISVRLEIDQLKDAQKENFLITYLAFMYPYFSVF